ncbi:pancreatic triacylglycerol lipase-like [Cimex lectularius]|uniref:Lipase domain-containing protein n=1 Tax=Cimex lectularius TaxID=79782 RepID=A0A8I6RP74_CIMLE|nr:pancreatic triacylglycerol lipase-like [Cimex lectularius]
MNCRHLLILLIIKGFNGKECTSQFFTSDIKEYKNIDNASFWFDAQSNVNFLLYTRYNEKAQKLIYGSVSSVMYSNYDLTKKTKILIHGWLNSGENFFCEQLKNAYLRAHDYNVIAVDWSAYSYNPYLIARFSINAIGPYVAKMIDFLIEDIGTDYTNVHVLGHSLGAHIAGLAGEHMRQNLSRITGMDPASPLILGNGHYRLDETDANFVDVIHTSVYYLGVYKPIGHVDFYPNGGGPLQPGCGVEIGVCTHRRSYRYYIESIFNLYGFMAKKCETWQDFVSNNCLAEVAFMGENASPMSRGKFYLRTATSPPFALGSLFF